MIDQISSTILEENTPHPFDFESTVYSHGWVALEPFAWKQADAELSRIQLLAGGKVVKMHLRSRQNVQEDRVQIRVQAAPALTSNEKNEIRRGVRRMLRLDEDFSGFYNLLKERRPPRLRVRPGGGRLLRCPTLFEDIVYTLCTTNIAWSGTKRMVEKLVLSLGPSFVGRSDERAFPAPLAIANAGAAFLRNEVRLGYRSEYILHFAELVAAGKLDLRRFEDMDRPTGEIREALLEIPGVGPYAAATILMLLGRYEELAIDTEMRAFVARNYFDGDPVHDSQIEELYSPWGKWKYLAYWFDLTGE